MPTFVTAGLTPRRARVLAVLAAAIGILGGAFGILTGGSAQASPTVSVTPATGVLWGASIKPRSGESLESAAVRMENSIGRDLDVHRDYSLFDTTFPTPIMKWDASRNITSVVSINAIRPGAANKFISWAGIAAGREDDVIRAQAKGFKAFGKPVFVTFNHEPENDRNNGTPAEYAAAWRHWVDVFRSEGVTNVVFNWIMMSYTFATPGEAEKYYPGDAYVDYVGADGYNWFGCRGGAATWREFSSVMAPFHAFGKAHGKPEMVAEVGSVEDPNTPGRKAQWITNMAATLKTWPEMKVVAWYESDRICTWHHDSTPATLAAYKAVGFDRFFNTRRSSGPSDPGTTDPTTPPTTEAPTTLPPTTRPPTTRRPPVTEAPTTTAPATTVPPTTIPDTTVPPTTAPPAPGPSKIAPIAMTWRVHELTPTSGLLGATVQCDGSGDTTFWFVWSDGTTERSSTPKTVRCFTGRRWTPIVLTDLQPGVTYTYRVVANNAHGTSVGRTRTFTTPAGGGASATEK